jgi:hypothetical protein
MFCKLVKHISLQPTVGAGKSVIKKPSRRNKENGESCDEKLENSYLILTQITQAR